MIAKGTKGFLIRVGKDGYAFRVYNKDFTFTDYDILHYDLEIEILDSDAHFYKVDDENYLDHSPQTLGIKQED